MGIMELLLAGRMKTVVGTGWPPWPQASV